MDFEVESVLFKHIFKLKDFNNITKQRKNRKKMNLYWKRWMKQKKKTLKKMSTKEIFKLMQKEIDENSLEIDLPTVD